MPSILFVHGAGHAAWCWHEHFTPWFDARGYTVAAPDLPHHGGLDRRGVRLGVAVGGPERGLAFGGGQRVGDAVRGSVHAHGKGNGGGHSQIPPRMDDAQGWASVAARR